MMLLRELLAPWCDYAGNESFGHLRLDSRQVEYGDVFVALPGHQIDGRQFIKAAFDLGAAAALVHTDDRAQHGQVIGQVAKSGGVIAPQIYIYQLSNKVSALAAHRYPLTGTTAQMGIVGITGTNGKTSVSQLIAQLISLMQSKAAVMGTLGNGIWGELVDSGNTTADAVTIMRQLHEFEAQGVQVCAMEVSSHGLVQGRVEAVPFDVAVFTNLTRDHLDYHGDMGSYAAAKQRLFTFNGLKHGVLNLDDDIGRSWLAELTELNLPAQFWGFSVQGHKLAAFYTKDVQFNHLGVSATLVWPEGEAQLQSPLLGEFNLSNVLAALAALYVQGESMQCLLTQVPHLVPIAGRMECFTSARKVTLVVDYAHTPDALVQALKALRPHCDGTLWCVFGCGGDRDTGKRPLMAQAAEQFADRLMITSDNARSEDPNKIICEIIQGLNHPHKALTQVERSTAIKQVLAMASSGDVILLAGKGHETYQEVAGVRYDYDERALARKLSELAV